MRTDDLPRDFPAGSELTGGLISAILRELWRWRRAEATPPLALDYADSDEPPILTNLVPDDAVPVLLTADLAAGSYSSPTSAGCTILVDKDPGPGFTATGGTPETLYNPYTRASFTSGSFCWARYRNGYLYVWVGDC